MSAQSFAPLICAAHDSVRPRHPMTDQGPRTAAQPPDHGRIAFDPARRPDPFGAVAALQSMSLRSIDPARRPSSFAIISAFCFQLSAFHPFAAVAALQSMSLRSILLSAFCFLLFFPSGLSLRSSLCRSAPFSFQLLFPRLPPPTGAPIERPIPCRPARPPVPPCTAPERRSGRCRARRNRSAPTTAATPSPASVP